MFVVTFKRDTKTSNKTVFRHSFKLYANKRKKVLFVFSQIFFSPSNIAIRIQQALDILHKEVRFLSLHSLIQPITTPRTSHQRFFPPVVQVPRVVVNLVELLNVVPLRDLHNGPNLGCPTWFVK